LSPLARALGKQKPFEDPEVETFLSIVRTASALSAPIERLFRGHGLSAATYNVLRILRGAMLSCQKHGPHDSHDRSVRHGRACHEIGEQMVTQVPDITRLVDRLEEAGLVERCRCDQDRRVVYVRITSAGLKLLAKLDEPLLALHKAQLAHMSRADLARLCALLEAARENAV
jgi:DNA-binding MarR family transcriptional regulator